MRTKKLGGRSGPPVQTFTWPNLYQKTLDRQESLPWVEIEQKTRLTKKGQLKNGTSYKPLATDFTLGGFSYRQIAREGDVAVYEQRWNHSPKVCYEVVHIQRRETEMFPSGRSYPAREVYPASETWGTYGFTVTDLDAAFNRLRQECRRRDRQTQSGTDTETYWNRSKLKPNTNRNANVKSNKGTSKDRKGGEQTWQNPIRDSSAMLST